MDVSFTSFKVAEQLTDSPVLDEIQQKMRKKMMENIDKEMVDIFKGILPRTPWRTCL